MRSPSGVVLIQLVRMGATLVCLLAVGAAYGAVPPLPGDPAPPMPDGEWVQRGVFDQVHPADGRLITVIEFWASWDPLSRALVPMHDRLQAELRHRGVRFLTVAEEPIEDTRSYIGQVAIPSLAVISDAGWSLLHPYRDQTEDVPLPFIVIVESKGQSSRLLWKGPAVMQGASLHRWILGYARDFAAVFPEIRRSEFSVKAARDVDRARQDLRGIRRQIDRLVGAAKYDDLQHLADQVIRRSWPAEADQMLAMALQDAAAGLAAEGRSREQIAAGLSYAHVAMDACGGGNPKVLDTYARALFLTGDLEGAVAAERKAVDLFEGSLYREPGMRESLARYEEAVRKRQLEMGQPAPPPAPAEANPGEPNPDEVPASVTGEDLAEDLGQLHTFLEGHWSGYDDGGRRLAAGGSSWEARTREFIQRAEAREAWNANDCLNFLAEYARVIPDAHLAVACAGRWNGEPGWAVRVGSLSHVPFFAEVRVREDAAGRMVAEAPAGQSELDGAEITGVEVIGSPTGVEFGKPYLFPTLPHDPIARASDGKDYLLGLMWQDGEQPPSLTIHIRSAVLGEPVQEREVTLPLHRGRVPRAVDREAGSFSMAERGVPVLEVNNQFVPAARGLGDTALKLRSHPVVVLDLRGDAGGSDEYASDWCSKFTDQNLCMHGGFCLLHLGQTDPLRKWESLVAGTNVNALDTPHYRGRLLVLMDSGCGSAGEGFVSAACQIEGAILLGENSAGACSYGNQDQSFECPHSRVRVWCGRSKGVFGRRSFAEGVGFFPDYWLDTDDPVKAVADYLRASAPVARLRSGNSTLDGGSSLQDDGGLYWKLARRPAFVR